jgi:hypothetical protein
MLDDTAAPQASPLPRAQERALRGTSVQPLVSPSRRAVGSAVRATFALRGPSVPQRRHALQASTHSQVPVPVFHALQAGLGPRRP